MTKHVYDDLDGIDCLRLDKDRTYDALSKTQDDVLITDNAD